MLKQLAQRIRVAIDLVLKTAEAACDQLKSCCGQHRLGKTPPWNASMIGVAVWCSVDIDSRGKERSIRHALTYAASWLDSLSHHLGQWFGHFVRCYSVIRQLAKLENDPSNRHHRTKYAPEGSLLIPLCLYGVRVSLLWNRSTGCLVDMGNLNMFPARSGSSLLINQKFPAPLQELAREGKFGGARGWEIRRAKRRRLCEGRPRPFSLADDARRDECTSSEQLGQIERGNKRVLSSSGLSSGHCLVMEPSSQFDSFVLDGLPPCENG